MKLTDLFEADNRKKRDAEPRSRETDVADDDGKPDLTGFYHHDDKPLTNHKSSDRDTPTSDDDEPHTKASPKGVDAEETKKATSGIKIKPEAARHFANLHRNMPTVGLDDTEHSSIVKRVTPAHLPAHLETSLAKAGDIKVRWHHVANLPGNAADAIRQLGKALFGALTQTPTDKITMIGNLGGQGKPNTEKEVQAVASYLKKFGEDMGPGHIDFNEIMPGYKAKIHHYVCFGTEFMLVQDFAGSYIYAWPVDDSKNGKVRKLAN